MRKSWFLGFLLATLATAAPAQVWSPSTINPEEEAKGLQKQLHLTDAQTAKVAAIYKESSEALDKINKSAHGDPGKSKKSIAALRASTFQKVRSVLTSDQVAKYNRLVKGNGRA